VHKLDSAVVIKFATIHSGLIISTGHEI